jgi:hypothetical protein
MSAKGRLAVPTKPLPDNPVVLENLLHAVTRLLEAAEPRRQQLNLVTQLGADVLEHDSSAYPLFARALEALEEISLGGIPLFHVVHDYLDLPTAEPSAPGPDAVLQRMEQLVHRGATINALVDRVQELHRRLLTKLEGNIAETAPDTESLGEAGALGPDSSERGPVSPRGRSARRRNGQAALDRWAIALDGTKWQVFQKHGQSWRHSGLLKPQPEPGRQADIMTAFLEMGYLLEAKELIQVVSRGVGGSEAIKVLRNIVRPTLGKLRKLLREALGLDKNINPIKSETKPSAYRLMVHVGFVETNDAGQLAFRPADDRAS